MDRQAEHLWHQREGLGYKHPNNEGDTGVAELPDAGDAGPVIGRRALPELAAGSGDVPAARFAY